MLSEKALTEFKEIYKEEYGVELEPKELTEVANRFMEIFKIVYRPMELKSGPETIRIQEPPIKSPLSFETPHLGNQS